VVSLTLDVTSTSITYIDATELGLISKLPIAFWIGLALLGVIWYLSKESKLYMGIAVVLTVAYLYVVPTVVKVPPSLSPQSYYPFGESALINSVGHLTDSPNALLISYHYWPLFLYFASMFTLVTGIPDVVLLKYFPLLTISLFGLLIFLILRVKLKTTYSLFGAAWFLGSFWLRQYYFGPPGMAFVFFLLIFLVASWIFIDGKAKNRTLMALLFFLFIITVLTHALTAFMSLVAIVALYTALKLVHKRPSSISAKLCLSLMLIFLSYNMHVAYRFFNLSVQTFYRIFLGAEVSAIYKEPARVIGSAAYLMNYASSWGIVILNGVIALVAVFLAIKDRTIKKGYFVFYLISLVILGLFGLVGEYGSNEAYQRAFMFGLIPLSFLCISLIAKKPKMLPIILIGLLFLSIPAQYGSDTYRLTSETELNGTDFFAIYTPQNISVLYKFSPYVRYHDPLKSVIFLSLGSLPYTSALDPSTVKKAVNEADYVIISSLQDNYYLYYLGATPFEQIDLGAHFNRIYDNGNLSIITHPNATFPP
jgi:hypothetical protein